MTLKKAVYTLRKLGPHDDNVGEHLTDNEFRRNTPN